MSEHTLLSGVVGFFDAIGIYDIVLPFILVFTIVFAILEKTKIFGTEKIDKEEYTKKNLNSMAAFAISFLVIASARLVEVIVQVSSQVVVLLFLGVFYLLLVGSFFEKGHVGEKGIEGWSRHLFLIIMFIGIVMIFLNAIRTESGSSWLEVFLGFISATASSAAVASIFLIIGMILFIYWLTKA